MTEPSADLLQTYCAGAFPLWQDMRTSNFGQLAAGWESVIYGFDLDYRLEGSPRHAGLVLRMYPGEGAREKAGREYSAIERMAQAGYPVPALFRLERDHSPFDQPFILMERIEGKTLWDALAAAPQPEQHLLMGRFFDLYARLHRLDWRFFMSDGGVTGGNGVQPPGLDEWLDVARSRLQEFGWAPYNPLFSWLEEHRAEVKTGWPAPIHGDFHPSNVLVRPDGTMVVIDWTNFSVSDARFDLAWTLVLTGSYLGRAVRDAILAGYERAAGRPVEAVEYFEVTACARRLFDLAISLSAGAEAMGMRAGAVQEMRAQASPARAVYQRLLEISGVRIEPFEQLLASFG